DPEASALVGQPDAVHHHHVPTGDGGRRQPVLRNLPPEQGEQHPRPAAPGGSGVRGQHHERRRGCRGGAAAARECRAPKAGKRVTPGQQRC
ncbi:unnamed protein product, partial [Ectocarpus sp. 4 AP-2014]